jgi:hypothetical protein
MRNNNLRKILIRVLTLAAVMAVSAVLLAACSQSSGAEAKVTEDLESMRYVELDAGTEAEIEAVLSERGREYFDMFLGKAGEFDYEITGADTNGDEAIVNVRIKTYDFAREYLKSWTEFLEATGDGTDGKEPEYDTALLYETIFRNLSSIQEKEYTADAAVICKRDEDGTWETDAASNSTLRNAVLGGLLGEISSLAGLE